jgi:hypothetical protein
MGAGDKKKKEKGQVLRAYEKNTQFSYPVE